MNYFVVQDWKNTKGNHAGMVHYCKLIKEYDPNNVKLFIVPQFKILKKDIRIIQSIYYFLLSIWLFIIIQPNSRLYLMEYLLPSHNQYIIARILSVKNNNLKILGLAHLVPSDILKYYNDDNRLSKWISQIDHLITLGSSLTNFFISKGISPDKISTMFHYVDHYFYNLKSDKIFNDRVKIIVMGNMKRDYDKLLEIISNSMNVNFIVCAGKNNDLINAMSNFLNVKVYGFVSEDLLKALMLEADASLCVMHDTVGSNVITTSMAMGLPLIVSDVGSIRDYCNDSNAIFCKSSQDFILAVQSISQNHQKLQWMSQASIQKSYSFSIEHSYLDLINV